MGRYTILDTGSVTKAVAEARRVDVNPMRILDHGQWSGRRGEGPTSLLGGFWIRSAEVTSQGEG